MSDELYVPRKCSYTNRPLTAKDHAAVQINIAHLDANGVYTREYTTVAFSGFLRTHALADQVCAFPSINILFL